MTELFALLYVGVGILLACWRHVRGCIVSMGGMVWTHNTSLAPPLIFEVNVPSLERNDRVFMCKTYRFLPLCTIFNWIFGNVPIVRYFLDFHFIVLSNLEYRI
jgi:hypothetical protein